MEQTWKQPNTPSQAGIITKTHVPRGPCQGVYWVQELRDTACGERPELVAGQGQARWVGNRTVSTSLRRGSKSHARAQLFWHLAQVDACSGPTWVEVAAAILADLRLFPGVALHQANQLWLLMCFIQNKYPQAADLACAEAGPGTRRGILYLMGCPTAHSNTSGPPAPLPDGGWHPRGRTPRSPCTAWLPRTVRRSAFSVAFHSALSQSGTV